MSAPDYTVVLGVDKKTIEYLRLVWPTWVKHKPSLLLKKFVIFFNGVAPDEIADILKAPGVPYTGNTVTYVSWPPSGVAYLRDNLTKWTNSQRACMLAGFVHVPVKYVTTPYFLKLDLDVVATGQDDWVDSSWFAENPSIIAPNWNYSKPPGIIQKLDAWVEEHKFASFINTEPLGFAPNPGSDKVCHPRFCSWCAFFSTEFNKYCAQLAESACGKCQLPCDSQDTFLYYVAERLGFSVRKVAMKKCGWQLKSSLGAVQSAVNEVLA